MFRILILSGFLLFQVISLAQERILNFEVDLELKENTDLLVTENILIQVEGKEIKRGIIRDIPLDAPEEPESVKRIFDFFSSSSYEIINVQRDGKDENYYASNFLNNLEIRIGDPDKELSPGLYTYTIQYLVREAIDYYDDFDELHWNATGHGWVFDMEKIKVRIILPEGVNPIHIKGYSGAYGETQEDFKIENRDGGVVFLSTRPYQAGEGLTVAVGWQKGLIVKPPPRDRYGWSIEHNWGYRASIYTIIIMTLYLMVIWFMVGRGPRKGGMVPHFDPPEDFSPGKCRYIFKQGHDSKGFVADLVDLAVKGIVKIEPENKVFTMTFLRAIGDTKVSQAQLEALKSMGTRVPLRFRKRSLLVGMVFESHKEALIKEAGKKYVQKNYLWLIPAGILLLLSLVFILISSPNNFEIGLLGATSIFFLPFIMVGCGLFSKSLIDLFTGMGGIGQVVSKFFTLFFLSLFWVLWVWIIYYDFSIVMVLPYFGCFIFFTFAHLMPSPTHEGRKILDHLRGLRLFMTKAEQYRFDALQDPKLGLELFERLLPYAIALDVENAWGRSFDGIVSKALASETTRSQSKLASGSIISARAISSSFSTSFASSVSTSRPSSSSSGSSSSRSSGSSGGGFSGGGRGGGGGRGW